MTLDEFINDMKNADQDYVKKLVEANFNMRFDVLDTNHDGYIQWEEYAEHFKIVKYDELPVREVFEALDTNKDGHISREEYMAAAVDFFTNMEDAPIKYMLGPLED